MKYIFDISYTPNVPTRDLWSYGSPLPPLPNILSLFPERQKGREEMGYFALSYGGEGYRVNIKMLLRTFYVGAFCFAALYAIFVEDR